MKRPSPVIGVTTSIDLGIRIRSGFEYFYLKRDYCRALNSSGATPCLLVPDIPTDYAVDVCDALLISGGDDLPMSLDSPAESKMGSETQERIDWERNLIQEFLNAEKLIFGVCYGLQLLNFHFGGSLWADIPSEVDGTLDHGGLGSRTAHSVRATPGSLLHGLFPDEFSVSSAHHQAVRNLAPGFSASGFAPDGIIEAIESDFAFAVEWHPESDSTRIPIYSFFARSAAASAFQK